MDDGFIAVGTKYYHQDHLSNRLVTDSSGNTLAQMGHFPFGESWYNSTGDKLLFTSYERDAESGNDYAQARYYVNRLARFSSPDPAGLAAVDSTNPQSWNQFAYVLDDPSDLVDPAGLYPVCLAGLEYDEVDYSVDGQYQGSDYLLTGNTCGHGTPFEPSYNYIQSLLTGSGSGNARNGGSSSRSDDNSSRPTVGPAVPVQPPCRIVDPFFAALEGTVKLGPEIQVGPLKVEGSLYKNMSTGETGGKMEANAALVSAQVDNPTPMGGSLGGGSEGRQYSVSFLGFQYNFTTESFAFKPSKSITFGIQLGVGGELSLNGDKFNQQSAANDACRAQGGK
ncbi:MAG: RHS repeat domain-containing protein [Candidatus Acidiferrales bacterium]